MKDTKLKPNDCDVSTNININININIIHTIPFNGNSCIRYRIKMRTRRCLIIKKISSFNFVFHFNIITVFTPQTALNVRISFYFFRIILCVLYGTRNTKYILYLPSILLCFYKSKTITIYVHVIVTSQLRPAVAQSVEA